MKRKPTADERYEIFRLWSRGLGYPTLGRLYNVDQDWVRNAVREEMERYPLPTQQDPEDVAHEYMIKLDAIIEDLAQEASRQKEGARVRALIAKFEALQHQFEVRRELGLMPDPADISILIDARVLVERLGDALEAGNAPPSVYDEFDRVFEPIKRKVPEYRIGI